MKEQFVTYEIALALKDLGFDEKCFKVFGYDYDQDGLPFSQCKLPLWQQAINWLLENHNILIQQHYYNFALITPLHYIGKLTCEQAILKAIEIIKTNNYGTN